MEEGMRLIETLQEVLGYMRVLSPRSLGEMLDVALSTGLTAYDASYITLAMRHRLTLVTEDSKLRDKAAKHVRVISARQLM